MAPTGGLISWHHLRPNRRSYGSLLMVHPLAARSMPDLGLPTMGDAARTTFLNIIQHEDIEADSSLNDVVQLAAARGFVTHPSDWVPQPSDYPSYPVLYQLWAIWLAENGYTPLSAGVPLTAENFSRFPRRARNQAFRRLYERDRDAAYDLLKRLAGKAPATVRLELMGELGGGASFSGDYPSDLQILEYFLNDKLEKVRQHCRERIQLMYGLETAEAHARFIARHFEIRSGQIVRLPPEAPAFGLTHRLSDSLYRNFECTTIDALAAELKVNPAEVVAMWGDEQTAQKLEHLIVRSDNLEARSALAQRFLEQGKECVPRLLRGCTRELWERAISLQMRSPYM